MTVEIERLQQQTPHDEQRIAALQQQHRQIVCELIELLDEPLRDAFAASRKRLDNVGLQYTEMVHDFFVKLLERDVQTNDKMKTFQNLKTLVATILFNQMRDFLKGEATHRQLDVRRETGVEVPRESRPSDASHVDSNALAKRQSQEAIAAEAYQKRSYFEERYRTGFLDFFDRIELWEESDDENLHLAARAMLLHYVAGEKWNVIEQQLGITTGRLNQLRQLAAREFQQK